MIAGNNPLLVGDGGTGKFFLPSLCTVKWGGGQRPPIFFDYFSPTFARYVFTQSILSTYIVRLILYPSCNRLPPTATPYQPPSVWPYRKGKGEKRERSRSLAMCRFSSLGPRNRQPFYSSDLSLANGRWWKYTSMCVLREKGLHTMHWSKAGQENKDVLLTNRPLLRVYLHSSPRWNLLIL